MNTHNHTKKLLLWDFDGVIADSFHEVCEAIIAAAKAYKLPIFTEQDVRNMYEINFFEGLVARGMKKEDVPLFMSRIVKERTERRESIAPYPGMVELLRELFPLHHMMIISSATTEEIQTFLRRFALDTSFHRVLARDAGYSKTEKITRMIQEAHVLPENTYYIGDTTGDMVEGKTAGVKTIAVTWGYHTEEMLIQSKPDHIARNVRELATFL